MFETFLIKEFSAIQKEFTSRGQVPLNLKEPFRTFPPIFRPKGFLHIRGTHAAHRVHPKRTPWGKSDGSKDGSVTRFAVLPALLLEDTLS